MIKLCSDILLQITQTFAAFTQRAAPTSAPVPEPIEMTFVGRLVLTHGSLTPQSDALTTKLVIHRGQFTKYLVIYHGTEMAYYVLMCR